VPRQYSTGGKQKLFGISKRGNIYLRRMLIHGARAVLFRIKYDSGGLGEWYTGWLSVLHATKWWSP
jgi:transposase